MNEWIAEVGAENAELLATRSRTAVLASEYRPKDVGDGRISYSKLALGAARELSEEEEGAAQVSSRSNASSPTQTRRPSPSSVIAPSSSSESSRAAPSARFE